LDGNGEIKENTKENTLENTQDNMEKKEIAPTVIINRRRANRFPSNNKTLPQNWRQPTTGGSRKVWHGNHWKRRYRQSGQWTKRDRRSSS
jgi:hypothetical protein